MLREEAIEIASREWDAEGDGCDPETAAQAVLLEVRSTHRDRDGQRRAEVRRPSGYSWRMAVGSMPNIRWCVRVRCDESAKPASCAASVHDAPAIAASMATLMRSHRR